MLSPIYRSIIAGEKQLNSRRVAGVLLLLLLAVLVWSVSQEPSQHLPPRSPWLQVLFFCRAGLCLTWLLLSGINKVLMVANKKSGTFIESGFFSLILWLAAVFISEEFSMVSGDQHDPSYSGWTSLILMTFMVSWVLTDVIEFLVVGSERRAQASTTLNSYEEEMKGRQCQLDNVA